MRNIPLFRIETDEKDLARVSRILRSGSHWAGGREVEAFERRICRFLRVKYCVTFNSGTSALYAALSALGLGRGDEVIVPSFSYIAVAGAPLLAGARPVFADAEPETFGLDPAELPKCATRKTKAVIAVHYGGCPCRIREIRKIAAGKQWFLIEDAAEAFGAASSGKLLGSFGDCGIFSFCQSKIITTGEGGCVVTARKAVFEKLRRIRSLREADKALAISPRAWPGSGFNLRMSSVAAALGVSQTEKVRRNIVERKRAAEYLIRKLSGISGITLPDLLFNPANIYQMFPVLVKGNARDRLKEHLRKRGIDSRVYFNASHRSPFFVSRTGRARRKLPVSEALSREVLCLPVYPSLGKNDIEAIARGVRDYFD